MINSVFVSFFNSNNIGDILLSNTLKRHIERNGYSVRPCSYEGSFKIEGKLEHDLTDLTIIEKLKNRYTNLLFWSKFEVYLKQSDVLILGGGNMIMDIDHTSKSGRYFNKFIKIGKKLNKKIIVLSIGVGPFKSHKQKMYARNALKKCDYVTYRDKSSYDLVGYDLPNHFISIDPVFMLEKFKVKEIANTNRIAIGVINTLLFDNSKERYNHIKKGYFNLISKLIQDSIQVDLFTTENADICMMDEIYELCSGLGVRRVYLKNEEDLLKFYTSGISLIISARMHSLIIGFTQDIPIIGLSWQQKVDSMFEIIEQSQNCIHIDYLIDNIDSILEMVKSKILDKSNKQNYNIKSKLTELYLMNTMILENIKVSLLNNAR